MYLIYNINISHIVQKRRKKHAQSKDDKGRKGKPFQNLPICQQQGIAQGDVNREGAYMREAELQMRKRGKTCITLHYQEQEGKNRTIIYTCNQGKRCKKMGKAI